MMDKADLYRSLKEYVVPEGTIVPCGQRKHCFYTVGGEELSEAEALLAQPFPAELRQFYLEVGYGYLGNDDPNFRNQLMHPLEVAKLKLGLDFYGNMYQEDFEYYTSDCVFPFFDLGGEADYLVIQLDGDCAGNIFYCGRAIASSFQDFVEKMCAQTDYFIGKDD